MTLPRLPKGFNAFLITESLGAFNDNFFKMLLQLFILNVLHLPNAESLIAKLAFAFTIPFVLFGPWAGFLADRFAKSQLIKIIKACEILIMALGAWVISVGKPEYMIAALFLLATHSAFFAPAKAGFIPEVSPPELISKANGLVGMTTFFSIILGTAVAGILMKTHHNDAVSACIYGIGFAVLGTITSFGITPTHPARPDATFPKNPFVGILRDVLDLRKQKGLYLACLAHSYFWLLGLILQTNIVVYGKHHLGLGEADSIALSALPAVIGVGIALGSMLAARWSGKKVEIGLVPLGGFGLALCAIGLFFSVGHYQITCVVLFFAGLFGGLYVIPLYSYIQFEAPEHEKGRILATLGIINGVFLVMGALLYEVLAARFHLTPAGISLTMGCTTILVTVYICTIIPEYFIRFLSWLLTHTLYDIRIIGQEHVPASGPVLLVPNHVSFVDAMLVGATLQRLIIFIMWKKIYDIPVVRQICQLMQVIPIAPYEGRESVIRSLEAARERLKNNYAVCIFAEGGITRDGDLHEFKGGMESIMKGFDCPIIPVYLHNVWGSIFSFEGGKVFWKFPKRIPYPITVSFGPPLPSHASAKEVEAAVRVLAEAFGKTKT